MEEYRQLKLYRATRPKPKTHLPRRLRITQRQIPSSAYLGVALGAMALSLVCQATGQGKWGNFIAQWVPTWLIIGVYNKLVKLEGHDQHDRT